METVPETSEKELENSTNNSHAATSNAHRRERRRAQTMMVVPTVNDDDDDGHFTLLKDRGRALSLKKQETLQRQLSKFYPKSHLLGESWTDAQYFSLWLLPPKPIRKTLATEIAKLSLKCNQHGSSAAFMPHVTVIGSIPCQNLQEARKLGHRLQQHLQHSGVVPCRFTKQDCQAMYSPDDKKLVWSQSCIAIMERSAEYMHLLQLARTVLNLPTGEWMFPAPACEPHFSKFYGTHALPTSMKAPDDFVAEEASLWATTPGTVEGVANWREVTRIKLCPP